MVALDTGSPLGTDSPIISAFVGGIYIVKDSGRCLMSYSDILEALCRCLHQTTDIDGLKHILPQHLSGVAPTLRSPPIRISAAKRGLQARVGDIRKLLLEDIDFNIGCGQAERISGLPTASAITSRRQR